MGSSSIGGENDVESLDTVEKSKGLLKKMKF